MERSRTILIVTLVISLTSLALSLWMLQERTRGETQEGLIEAWDLADRQCAYIHVDELLVDATGSVWVVANAPCVLSAAFGEERVQKQRSAHRDDVLIACVIANHDPENLAIIRRWDIDRSNLKTVGINRDGRSRGWEFYNGRWYIPVLGYAGAGVITPFEQFE